MIESIIPEKIEGKHSDLYHSATLASKEDALEVYAAAGQRLLNPNTWHHLAGELSAEFILVDAAGNKLPGPATPGDYIQIDIPGPGTAKGKGFDWVRISSIKETEDDKEKYILMTVKPSSNPTDNNSEVAHFFKEGATSTFLIRLSGSIVRASYHGRNEVPNISADKITDKIRNAIVGNGAITIFSGLQWNALLNGFLRKLN